MDIYAETLQVVEHYSQILSACQTRHVRDPRSERVISSRQARILDQLNDRMPISLTELASRMGVTLSTMSLAVNRLERLDLVHRDRDPLDGRRLQLTITEDGVRMKEARTLLDPEQVRMMLARLSLEDRQQAIRGLGLLAEAARVVTGDLRSK